MIKTLIVFCFIANAVNALAQPALKLFSQINSIGYQVILPNDYDPDSTAQIKLGDRRKIQARRRQGGNGLLLFLT